MKLSKYLNKYPYVFDKDYFDHEIEGIYENSKQVTNNSVFVAMNGYKSKGINYIEEAIEKGARTIILDDINYYQNDHSNINFLYVKSSKVELARLLKWYYRNYHQPIFIGVTGTNGKTTVTNLVYEFFLRQKKKVIYLGTSIIKSFVLEEKIQKTMNTTPCITQIYENVYENDYDYVVMEVSSQGICEGRILGIDFDVVCFTNITQDHLDYHRTMDNYASAKARLIEGLNDDAIVILNEEMAYYKTLKELSICKLLTYSKNAFSNNATLVGRLITRNIDSMTIAVWENNKIFEMNCRLVGDFNLENILASYLIISSLGYKKEDIINFYPTFKPVRGRMNVYKLKQDLKELSIVVDYAHTPEGLKQVIEYYVQIKTKNLRTIIGCGGERDHEKRPIMGLIATKLSDYTYFTEDNSRNELVNDIIDDICRGAYNKNYEIIYTRERAIDKAIADASDQDIILLLGKGAEEYITSTTKRSFSDLEYIEKLGGKRC